MTFYPAKFDEGVFDESRFDIIAEAIPPTEIAVSIAEVYDIQNESSELRSISSADNEIYSLDESNSEVNVLNVSKRYRISSSVSTSDY